MATKPVQAPAKAEGGKAPKRSSTALKQGMAAMGAAMAKVPAKAAAKRR